MLENEITENLKHHISWHKADAKMKENFVRAMRNCTYGSDETLDAWLWFSVGWRAHAGST